MANAPQITRELPWGPTGPRRVRSESPTTRPVTVSGWYPCEDGTWAECRGAAVNTGGRPDHYDRPPTAEEIEWQLRHTP